MKIRKEYLKKWQTFKPGFWKKAKEAENMEEEKQIQNQLRELLTKEIALLEKLLKREKPVRDMAREIIDGWKDGEYLGIYNPDRDEWRFMNTQLASLVISLIEKYLLESEETT